jgi:putative copper export protein
MGKICLFLAMLAVALINRRILLPRLLAQRNAEPSVIALSRTVGVEQALGVVVLVLVSILGMLPPPH